MREKIGKITLDDTCYSGSDLYSDGPVEEETSGDCEKLSYA